jgi:hypothetical protein
VWKALGMSGDVTTVTGELTGTSGNRVGQVPPLFPKPGVAA